MSAVADALEQSRVESHLHPQGSFDVDDHEVPTGREEIWRFTPLKRLRGLHADAALDGSALAAVYDLPGGVTVDELDHGDARQGSSGFVPTDRIAARVWHGASQRFAVTVPPEAALAPPAVGTGPGGGLQ